MRLVLFAILCLANFGKAATDYSAWKDSVRIYFNANSVVGDIAKPLDNFPLLIRFDSMNLDFKNNPVLPGDFRFRDADGQDVASQWVNWDAASGKGEIWIRVSRFDPNSKTDFVTLFWNHITLPLNGYDNPTNDRSVFDSLDGYAGVWHLNEENQGILSKGFFYDGSNAKNPGDLVNNGSSPNGVISRSQHFNGTSNYIRVPNSKSLDIDGPLTISAWVNPYTLFGTSGTFNQNQVNTILRKGGANPNQYQLSFRNGHLTMVLNADESQGVISTKVFPTKKWTYVVGVWDGKNVQLYVDGILDVDHVLTNAANLPNIPNIPVYIGGRLSDPTETVTQDFFDGDLDEVRLMRKTESADWVRMEYENQKVGSKLLTFQSAPPKIDTVKTEPVVVKSDTTKIIGFYEIYPGKDTVVTGNIKIANPEGAKGPIQVEVISYPDLPGLGVSNVSRLFKIKSGTDGSDISPVTIEKTLEMSEKKNLYEVLPGKVGLKVLSNFGSNNGTWTLTEAGTYFLGQDTLRPVIHVLDFGMGGGDSSWIDIVAEDNVQNLNLTVSANGTEPGPAGSAGFLKGVTAGEKIHLVFLGKEGLSHLGVSVRIWDGTLDRVYPSPPAVDFSLLRTFKKVKAPIELKPDFKWRLSGFPLIPSQKVLMKDLVKEGNVYGAIWENWIGKSQRGTYKFLKGDDSLPTGKGIWLSSRKAVAEFEYGNANTPKSDTTGIFHLNLEKGWNQITCPALHALPWPISHRDTVAEDLSSVKGLQAIDDVKGGYQDVDSLRPWIGYFVHSNLDTTVSLNLTASAKQKTTAQATTGLIPVEILLQSLESPGPQAILSAPIRMGAALYAKDEVGIEDAPMPPPPGRFAVLSAVRNGSKLKSDLIGYQKNSPLFWKVAWTAEQGLPPEVGQFRVSSVRLPKNMTLWAVAPLRKVKEKIESGSVLEVLGDDRDTLMFMALPSDWSGELPGIRSMPLNRNASWSASTGTLHLGLPAEAGIEVSIINAKGQKLAYLQKPNLVSGYYDFQFPTCLGYHGLMIVTLDLNTPGNTVGKKPTDSDHLIFRTTAP